MMLTRRQTLATLAASALPLSARAQNPVRVAYVYPSLIGDAGWTYQHDQGRRAVEAAYGNRVQTAYVENIEGGADAERVFRQFASQGYDIIFGTSFNHMNPMVRVAAQFPRLKFEHATGYTQDENLAIYHTRAYESRYLVGMVAGAMGDSLGVVASFPIPEVLRGINAMTLGARSVNPNFTTKVVWISSWFDPGLERTASEALIDQGVKTLAHFTDSPAVVQAAEDRKAYVVALGDMGKYGPNSHLTALVYNWGPYYVDRVGKVLDGTWKTSNTWVGISGDLMTIAPFNAAVPQPVRERVLAKKEEIRTGKFHPFAGPLVAQDGSVKVAAGALPEDGFLLGMDFYVQGVEGSLPKG
jgi:simple sugar transport system substrate-binding protein